ncbi:SusC/RagA family TonB-linked outer membrane protein [Compostibacter hankyongensis]|uniref:TonB-dependent receptor n=1 Tax=Compostibacter hankyongensis TaxID=1007089 RepID=A0ABP8FE55_9BACT
MKLSVFLLLWGCFQASAATGYSQERVTLNLKNAGLKKVLHMIEQQTDYRFIFSDRKLPTGLKVNVEVSNAPLPRVLDTLLASVNQRYRMLGDNLVVIMPDGTNAAVQQISGRVIDKASGAPLVGVSVNVKGTSLGTSTDAQGNFTLEVPDDAILRITYIGYEAQEVAVAGQKSITVVLAASSTSLNQVVVVGYGTQKKANLTGAVAQIDSKMLENRPVANITQALQGLVPNLSVNFNDGRPGSQGKINIRGYTSVNSGSPLVLIDGVPGDINLINPLDVASISVLKDASSAAIYGARAAYGVILVTTKQGQQGKLKVSYSNNFSFGTPTTPHDFMTDGYATAKLIDEAFRISTGNSYTGYTDEDYAELEKRQTDHSLPSVVVQNRGGRDQYVWYGNTDWWHYFFRETLPSMSHSLQFTGGSEKIDFLVSGRYYQQLGMMQMNRDKYTAYNLRAKINAHITPWLTLSNNLQFAANTYNYPGDGSNGGPNTAFIYLGVHALPSYVPVNPDGTFTYRSQLNNYGIADGRNVQLQYGKAKSQEQEFDLTNTVSLTLQPTPELSIVGSYSYDLNPYSNFHRSTKSPWSIYPGQTDYIGDDWYSESSSQDQYHVVNAYATYTKDLGKHALKILGGYNQELKKYHTVNGRANNLLSEDLNALDLGTSDQQVGSNSVEWALLGFFGRINYSYADKYLLELNGRYDGSSHFPEGSRFGFFPSVSAGWRISEEPFFAPLKRAVSELKLRGSYGSLGNQSLSANLRNSNYPYIPVMSTGLSSWLTGDSKTQYLRVGSPVSPELTWERTTSANIGIDLGFMKNRLNVTFDWYDRKTLDMLIAGKTLPAVFGAASPKQNAGDLDSKGWELSVQWNDERTVSDKPFSYSIGFVLSDFKSHITRFDNPLKQLNNHYVGERIGDIWGYTVDGYFKTDEEAQAYGEVVNQDFVNKERVQSPGDGKKLQAGDMKFVDLSGDSIINNGQNTLADHGDMKIIGNSLPRYNFGITASASWNGFDLSVFFQGVGHQDWYPGNETYFFWGPYGRPYYSFIPKDIQKDIWSPDNPNAYFPKLRGYVALNGNTELQVANTRYIQNIAYIRLKNLSVGYSLPLSLIQRWKIDRVHVYFSGENLFTATGLHSKYVDPEQVSADPNGSRGDNNARNYPFMKNYSFGLDITF